jgi:hypothetical protein
MLVVIGGLVLALLLTLAGMLYNHEDKLLSILTFFLSGVFTLAIACKVWYNAVQPKKETKQSVDFAPIQKSIDALRRDLVPVIEQSRANLANQEPQQPEQTLPGFSGHFIVKLGAPVEARDNYIFDGGEGATANRVSIFIDDQRRLCFKVIDSMGNPRSIVVTAKLETFSFSSSTIYLECDFGSNESESVLRVVVNGHLVSEDKKPVPIVTEKPLTDYRFVVGADLFGRNGGVFELGEFFIVKRTLTRDEAIKALDYFNRKIQTASAILVFSGNQWMETEGKALSAVPTP